MKTLVLAAGRGERMRPLTDEMPKALLEVGGKALIEHHLLRLAAAGVAQVMVNLSWKSDKVRARLGDGSAYGLSVEYSDEGPEPLETAGAIVQVRDWLGARPFLVVNADIWTDFPFEHLALPPARQAHLVLVPNPPHRPGGDFDVAGERLTYSGIGLFAPAMFHGLAPGKRALGAMLQSGWEHGDISGERYEGVWQDIGTPERLAQLRAQVGRA